MVSKDKHASSTLGKKLASAQTRTALINFTAAAYKIVCGNKDYYQVGMSPHPFIALAQLIRHKRL